MSDLPQTDASTETLLEDEHSVRAAVIKRGPPPKEWDWKKLEFFEHIHETEIKLLASGLSIDEVLGYYGLMQGMLPDYDEWFFNVTYNRGRIDGKNKAVKKLFGQMSEKTGTAACLAYLRRFGDEFQGEDDGANGTPKAIEIRMID